jgi:PAS domain S-box-containing protein
MSHGGSQVATSNPASVRPIATRTKREQSEDAFRKSEAHLHKREPWSRDVLDALPGAVYTVDAVGRITFYNQAAADLWGHRPELGTDAWCGSWRLYWPDGTPMPHDQCPMAVALKENRTIRGGEAVAERPDGTRVPFLAYPSPLHDESGTLVGAVNMLVDITERKRNEAELRRHQQDLEDFFENGTVALHWVTGDGTILRANQAELDLLGYSREEYIGRHIAEFHADRASIEDILARLSRGERLDKYEARLRAKDGSIRHVLVSSNVRFDEGRFVNTRCFTVDVTEQKQAEEKTRLLTREVDHRAKNMLATVQAIARMTQAETVPAFIDALMGRLDALSRAHTLLAESRWTGAALKNLVEEELAAYLTNDGGRVTISGPELTLCADAAQVLAMTFHELATNAVKYGALSVPGGRVAVEWSWESAERLILLWTETGGPPVRMPSRRGFGSSMIEGAVNGQLDGTVQLDWPPEGLSCRMTIPRPKLLEEPARAPNS